MDMVFRGKREIALELPVRLLRPVSEMWRELLPREEQKLAWDSSS
jgi:hypothetical protein